ncbi:MAG: DUF1566 domain-containing protein, partial [Planctomycetes bacterium]|nr:DUF1566 domain-containing protein [Planctomycetota bacterium]
LLVSKSTARFYTYGVAGAKVVLDRSTSLIWQYDYAEFLTWQESLNHCEKLSQDGHADWRLPNRRELISLINYDLYIPASSLPNNPAIVFWASTTSKGWPDSANTVDFMLGDVTFKYKNNKYAVRCVRDRF